MYSNQIVDITVYIWAWVGIVPSLGYFRKIFYDGYTVTGTEATKTISSCFLTLEKHKVVTY
jgi:hypothetical protein